MAISTPDPGYEAYLRKHEKRHALPTDPAKRQLTALLEHVPMPRMLALGLTSLSLWGVAGCAVAAAFAVRDANYAGSFLTLIGGLLFVGLLLWCGVNLGRVRAFTSAVNATSIGLARAYLDEPSLRELDNEIPDLLGEAVEALSRVGATKDGLDVIEASRSFAGRDRELYSSEGKPGLAD